LLEQEVQDRFLEYFERRKKMNPDIANPGGESARQVQQRVSSFLNDICERHHDQTVAIVTHGGVIRTLLWHLIGTPFELAREAKVDNTSLSSFVSKHGVWSLQMWNDTAHLSTA
jgi:probable phosphoglycerate mutase